MPTIERLYVDRQVSDLPEAAKFIEKIGITPEPLDHIDTLFDGLKAASDPQAEAKRTLLLTRNRGTFLKQCPGTKAYTCCGYQILHIGSYCTMDCAYCILQTYFHPPVLQYFVNHDDLMAELNEALGRKELRRIGTGEYTDSLIWEKWSDLTRRLIHRFSAQTRAVLELKTKTTSIERLKDLDHNRKTIVSWSLNTPHIIATQERGTAGLKARLRAAAKCRQWGYPLAFHFDPMVIYPGCEKDYRQVLDLLFDAVSADAIVWVSMGTFRFMPALQPVIEKRFPDSTITCGEFIPGLDGKMRYFKPLRIRLYRTLAEHLRQAAPDVTAYLCMEDEQVWQNSLGFTPQSRGGLTAMLDGLAAEHCGLSL